MTDAPSSSAARRVLVCAGDLSGDLNCSLLVRELMRRHPQWSFDAIGGAHLAASGAELVGNSAGLGVIGIGPALATVPRAALLYRRLEHRLRTHCPDCVVLCDWGAFNGRCLKLYARLNIPVLYYFPPGSWKKRGSGGLAIAPWCAKIATPFRWSAQRLNEVGGHAEWVGHPLLESQSARTPEEVERLRAEFGAAPGQPLIGLLPGSRALEVKYIGPHVAGAAKLLRERENARCVVAAAPGTAARLRRVFGAGVLVVEGRTADVLGCCDAAIVKSGTSTLEAAVAGAPQVVVYEGPKVLYLQIWLTGLRHKIPLVAMPNIILDRMAVPELLGENCRAETVAQAIGELLHDPVKRSGVAAAYAEVRDALGENLPYTATGKTADLVAQLAQPGPLDPAETCA